LSLQAGRTGEPDRPKLTFLVLAQRQLGKKDEAKATLARLREVMNQERWVKIGEGQGFKWEAKELVERKAGQWQ
jgi:hypothetical protein